MVSTALGVQELFIEDNLNRFHVVESTPHSPHPGNQVDSPKCHRAVRAADFEKASRRECATRVKKLVHFDPETGALQPLDNGSARGSMCPGRPETGWSALEDDFRTFLLSAGRLRVDSSAVYGLSRGVGEVNG